GDAIAINQIKERNYCRTELTDQLLVMVVAAANASQALKEIAVRDGPFTSTFTPENPKDLPCIIRNALLPFYVVATRQRVCGVVTLLEPRSIGCVNEVGISMREICHG